MNTPPELPALPFMRLDKNGDVLLDIHVVPNAAKTQAVGLHGETGELALRLRLQAPPVDGKANQALVKWLAGCLGIPQQAVTLARGETSRRKQLRVAAAAASRASWDELVRAAAGKDDLPT
ncbi:hypothetical protein SAMN05216350_110116 [Polaromonas sp. YR568]|uniref:DUF167 domain-containing protein n=1 Tax=Polaromonas sp. YR568 TaxID=1855301 RepID=UPI0008E95D41|nr:DUF167 domain-containing protein [Polaromonas sp. YR568]SFU98056.1 hypothetical protein SAMN05216350_110116 [Polaromonas sp. YR568]